MGESGVLFFGTYDHNLDDKQRLTIPSKMRNKILNSTVYVSKGFEGSLEMRTEEEFEKWSSQILNLSSFNKEIRMITREIIANTHEIEIDKIGRIKIPNNLLKLANIEKSVYILGMGDRVEIWDQKSYDNYQNDNSDRMEEIAETIYQGLNK
ncbi:cell division/cell wall cluster transcriptional repressor MraZ [Mesoplasma florum]|uniref:division/cell wall cluster transcriptional repressor MraZ n=1 Tax=Mesoplasma florum TaxID=2151 RepID=UPI000D0436A4|nr:division/cell wall cluster transcriptional repressor MraZ [Mesoplasma florum]AVN63777.1 cell division/cell wall cluster transcriptional repressor MraZ [Mesoplasma florum]